MTRNIFVSNVALTQHNVLLNMYTLFDRNYHLSSGGWEICVYFPPAVVPVDTFSRKETCQNKSITDDMYFDNTLYYLQQSL